MKLIDLTIDELYLTLKDIDANKFPHKALEISNEIERRKVYGEKPTIDIKKIIIPTSSKKEKNKINFFFGQGKRYYYLRGIEFGLFFVLFMVALIAIIIEKGPIRSFIWYLIGCIAVGYTSFICFKEYRKNKF